MVDNDGRQLVKIALYCGGNHFGMTGGTAPGIGSKWESLWGTHISVEGISERANSLCFLFKADDISSITAII